MPHFSPTPQHHSLSPAHARPLPRHLERRLKRHVRAATHDFFAVCAPSFEPVLYDELCNLQTYLEHHSHHPSVRIHTIAAPTAAPLGGIAFTGHVDVLYAAHLYLRTAHRILWRVAEGLLAQSYPMLFDKVRRLPWEHFLAASPPTIPTYTLRVTSKKSRLNHNYGIAETLERAIAHHMRQVLASSDSPNDTPALEQPDGHGQQHLPQRIQPNRQTNSKQTSEQGFCDPTTHTPPTPANLLPPVPIHVRLFQDHITLSINTSGTHLHKRGYRHQHHPAPIRETLAAAILQHLSLSSYDVFLDPMCGSGTFPIEAARLAQGLPAPLVTQRTFGFYHLPTFQPQKWQRIVNTAPPWPTPTALTVFAGDSNPAAIALTRQHAHAAQVAATLTLTTQDASAWFTSAGRDELLKTTNNTINKTTEMKRSSLQVHSQNHKKLRLLVCCNAPYGKRLGDTTTIAHTLTSLYDAIFANATNTAAADNNNADTTNTTPALDITLAILTSPAIAQELHRHSHQRASNLSKPPQLATHAFKNGGLAVVLSVWCSASGVQSTKGIAVTFPTHRQ